MSREYTADEICDKFMNHGKRSIQTLAGYLHELLYKRD